ncbi:formylglycine-generating enzyme [Gammaproteobacteria bacterium]
MLNVQICERTDSRCDMPCEHEKIRENYFYFAADATGPFEFTERQRSDGSVEYGVSGTPKGQDSGVAQQIASSVICSESGIAFLTLISEEPLEAVKRQLDQTLSTVRWVQKSKEADGKPQPKPAVEKPKPNQKPKPEPHDVTLKASNSAKEQTCITGSSDETWCKDSRVAQSNKSGATAQSGDNPQMVSIPGGCFMMGSPQGEKVSQFDQDPHQVCVKPFKMGRTEITQQQWKTEMGRYPSNFQGCPDCPVEKVSVIDIQDYLKILNARTGVSYRLPTEEEWEYACRGGRTGELYCGGNGPDEVAWHWYNSGGKTHPVGGKKANGYGLYDMSGNVWEWTSSCLIGYCSKRVYIRGGSWFYKPNYARSAARLRLDPSARGHDVGFRLVQSDEEPVPKLDAEKPLPLPIINPHAAQSRVIPRLSNSPQMVSIPGGCFMMGSPRSKEGHGFDYKDDQDPHQVCVKPLEIGKTEVTQQQWEAEMGSNPSIVLDCLDCPEKKPCPDCPVNKVSWIDIQEYLKSLNARTGKSYRLPTEEEWEYACRGGQTGELYCGSNNLDDVAWHWNNSGGNIHPVGGKKANGYGLYDMNGNVEEWTSSCWQGDCSTRVVRGGSWGSIPSGVRSAYRANYYSSQRGVGVGFRLVQDSLPAP